jgi:hypothetical protein
MSKLIGQKIMKVGCSAFISPAFSELGTKVKKIVE